MKFFCLRQTDWCRQSIGMEFMIKCKSQTSDQCAIFFHEECIGGVSENEKKKIENSEWNGYLCSTDADKTEDPIKSSVEFDENEDFMPKSDRCLDDENSRDVKDFLTCTECYLKVERKMFDIHMKRQHNKSKNVNKNNKMSECKICGQLMVQQFLDRHIKQMHKSTKNLAKKTSYTQKKKML